MKRKLLAVLLTVSMTACIMGCGAEEGATEVAETAATKVVETEASVELVAVETGTTETTEVEQVVEETEVEETREGMVRSELTNEWIDESLKDQRPIAAMVDNEKTAFPHYGVNQCDIVYENMNSTQNGRVTRLMCIMKDYAGIKQLGSIRSVRTTNFMVAAEYNAIILHDGGPFYIDEYIAKPYSAHLSGGFARIPNGKASEFTEYVTYDGYTNSVGKSFDGLKTRLANSGISTTFTDTYPGPHFKFSNKEYKLSDDQSYPAWPVTSVKLPFPHNSSALKYNEETQTYDYSVYGNPHVDALDNKVTTFKNVILQSCTFKELDPHGYLTYDVVGSGDYGYYLTNGEMIEIKWSKATENDTTHFYNKTTGEEIKLNTGKTYIAIVPADAWNDMGFNQ